MPSVNYHLRGLALESHRRHEGTAIVAAAVTAGYITDRFLPDKAAIDLVNGRGTAISIISTRSNAASPAKIRQLCKH